MNYWNIKFQNYWANFSKSINIKTEQSDLIYQRLFTAYQEKPRHYHTVQHIVECLDLYQRIRSKLQEPLLVELAIWFHDVVYDPKSIENEYNSALLMQELCTIFLSESQINKIFHWILATKNHEFSEQSDLNYLLDIDLAILGASSLRFLEYEQQIQQEYAWVASPKYQIKRTEVLGQFFNNSPIYKTQYFQALLESQAQSNLKKVLASLEL